MTEEPDNPLERILDEVILDPRKEGKTPTPDAELSPEATTPESPSKGTTSRAYRFLADDAVFKDILQAMAKVSHEDLDKLDSARFGTGEYKSLDQVARETGIISFEQQDAVFRTYLERRVDELKEKLVGAQIGSYSIIGELGRGGMGIVFKARQESPMFTREVALKFMLAGPESQTHDRERFISEVKGLAGLSHPFLVPIFDSGIEGELYYFSMEFIDGHALSDSSVTDDLSIEKKVEIVRDIARALGYLHDQEVIHRDVKPGNIMLDRHGNAMLLDFGIAQFSADPRRRVAQAGTPFYMAPEVIAPAGDYGPIGPRTDIYALGAVLYKLLTGQEVFPYEDDVTEVFRKTLKTEPSFSTTRKRIVHPDLERIMRRCLRKRVDERYASAGEMADALDRFLKRTRFKLWHVVGAAAIVVLSSFAVAVSFRDEPPQTSAGPDPIQLSSTAQGEATKLRSVDFEKAGLPEPERKRLEERIEELVSDAREVTTLEAASQFTVALETFLVDAAGQLRARADSVSEAQYDFLNIEESLWWRDGIKSLARAKGAGTNLVALNLFVAAIDSFSRATQAAEAERKARVKLYHTASEANRARLRTEDSTSSLSEHLLSFIRSLPEANELFNRAEKSVEYARQRLMDAEEEKKHKDVALATRYYERAWNLFDESKRDYDEARAMGIAARNAFTVEKDDLYSKAERFRSSFHKKLPAYAVNLKSTSLKLLETTEQDLQGLTEPSDPSSLDLLKKRYHRWTQELEQLQNEFQRVERGLLKLSQIVDRTLKKDFLKRLPRDCLDLVPDLRESLQKAQMAVKAGEFRGAVGTYGHCRDLLADIEDEFKKVTGAMIWIDDGRLRDGTRVQGFWIDPHKVTVKAYRRYRDSDPDAKDPFNWKQQLESPDAPVVGVNFADAQAFAADHGKSLANEAQWKLARQRASELSGVGGSNGAPELVRPLADGNEALIISDEGTTTAGEASLFTQERLTGFRCILEAVSWKEGDAR